MSDVAFLRMPSCESFRLVDFDTAELHPGFTGGFILVVSGEKPYLNLDVKLVPRVYVRQPEYWGIEVVGSLRGGVVPDVTAPYTVALPLEGTVGTNGIEVIGATTSKQLKLEVSKSVKE